MAAQATRQADDGAAPVSYTHLLETNGNIDVFDIWESQAAFETFGATLMPILAELGIEPHEPMVAQVHNTIEG